MEPSDEYLLSILREEMAKAALAAAQQVSLDLSAISATFDAAVSEAPRSTAILIAALLDDELTRYLERQLHLSSALRERLFSGHGAFSILSSKIDICHALGWIADDHAKNLHLIRKIRNEFAHNPKIHSFDQEPIAPLVRSMVFNESLLERMGMENLKAAVSDVKVRYLVACIFMLHTFLWTMVVGPVSLQFVGSKKAYAPKYEEMSEAEKSVIDWCIKYVKHLEHHYTK
jgi:hypothetical protein